MTMSDEEEEEACCDGNCDHYSAYSGGSQASSSLQHNHNGAVSPGSGSPVTDGDEASYAGSKTSETVVAGAAVLAETPGSGASGASSRRYEVPRLPRRTDFGEYYPDGGWGWTVCGAAFIVQFLCQGFHLAAGTLIIQIQNEFHTQQAETVWLGSATYGVSLLVSPFVIAFCRRKSVRVLAVVGGLISCLGCLFMSFSTQLHQLYVSTGLVLGLGSGITLSTAGIMVGRYFSRRRESAEMLSMSGGGVGMALLSVFIKQIMLSTSWMRSFQIMVGVMFPTLIGGTLYRSTSLYHPRRRAILHIKNMRKSKKQQKEFENKPPYLDFSPLRMRAVQYLMVVTVFLSAGVYPPFIILPLEASKYGLDDKSTLLLLVFMGIAYAFGTLLFGLIVIRSSLRCMVARQYLTQIAAFGAGIASLLFTVASGFNAYAMFVCTYGFLSGGLYYCIKVYTYELVTVKLSERTWGYIALAQSIPAAAGPPLALYLNLLGPSESRTGFLFCGGCLLFGCLLLFLMPCASKHRSNHEVLQAAHLHTRHYDDDYLHGMDVSEDLSAGKPHDISFMYPYMNANSFKRRLELRSARRQLGLITEEDGWSDLDAMSPMSPTDKVTEFLVNSQTMLQNYSQLHRIELPAVRLEINNEYCTGSSAGDHAHANHLETVNIKELKLEATLFHQSPAKKTPKKEKERNNRTRALSEGGGSPTRAEFTAAFASARHSPDISPLVERVSTFPRRVGGDNTNAFHRSFHGNHVNNNGGTQWDPPQYTARRGGGGEGSVRGVGSVRERGSVREGRGRWDGVGGVGAREGGRGMASSAYRYYGNSMKSLPYGPDPDYDSGFDVHPGPRPAKSVPLLVTCEKTTTV